MIVVGAIAAVGGMAAKEVGSRISRGVEVGYAKGRLGQCGGLSRWEIVFLYQGRCHRTGTSSARVRPSPSLP